MSITVSYLQVRFLGILSHICVENELCLVTATICSIVDVFQFILCCAIPEYAGQFVSVQPQRLSSRSKGQENEQPCRKQERNDDESLIWRGSVFHSLGATMEKSPITIRFKIRSRLIK